MDTTKNQKPLSLEQVLVSYNQLIFIFFLFIILMVILLATNQKGFNKSFGYQIFITGPILIILAFLIKEIFVFKNNPQSSWLSSLSQHTETWFLPAITLIILAIALLGFFMMLYIGGIFSDPPPQNNTAMILNFAIIIIFIITAALIYKQSNDKDDDILKTLPKALQDTYHARTKYTVIFALFCLFITLLYFVNPWGLMTNYGGPVIFFTLFVGIIMVIMISIYQYFLANPSKVNSLNDTPGPLAFIIKAIYILAAIGISFGLIYGAFTIMGVFEQDASKPESWGHLIFNLLLFCGMLAIIYKLANAGGFLDKNPFYRLILNTLLYIPCLLVIILNSIAQLFGFIKKPTTSTTGTFDFTPPKPFEIKMLLLSLFLLGFYFLWIFFLKKYTQSKYLKQGGNQLVNQPIPTDILTNIATYQTLSGSDSFDYQYALSFWLYLDSFPPSTTSSYTKVVPILSYGENPTIKYSSANNTLYITVKQKTDTNSVVDFIKEADNQIKPDTNPIKWKAIQNKITDAIENVKSMPFANEIDADGHRIIYKHPDVKLQKWNHILLNYSGGTLDVFYNGQLVKSAIEVVPYMKFDMLTAGTQDGVSGNIANLMYFKHPLDILTINTLYMSLKDKNPPVIPSNNETLIPL
jgi:hypothetical protein